MDKKTYDSKTQLKSTLRIALGLSIAIISITPAQAVVAPYYAYGNAYTRTGAPDFSLIEENSREYKGKFSTVAGPVWLCSAGDPGCGISVAPGASSARAEVSVDPVNGILGARAGSLVYDAYGGYGRAYGYISQVLSVGSDGSLLPGDSVSIDASMLLQGTIDADSALSSGVAGLVMVNYYDSSTPPAWHFGESVDYIPVTGFEDIFYTPEILDPMLATVRYPGFGDTVTSPVDFLGSSTFDVVVGDKLLVETMLYVTSELGYNVDLNDSWTDFQHTMQSSLTTTTAGATLNAVPVPASMWLFGSGLIGLITVARRKKTS